MQKCLLGTSQTLFKLHPLDAGCAFLRNASILRISKKSTPKADAKSTFGVFRLPALLPVRLRCLICKESLDIFLCPQKPLHLLSGLAVFRVDCLLLLEQFSVLSVQLLHLGQLFDTLLIKKFFGCLVKQDVRLMLSAELFAVPSLTVVSPPKYNSPIAPNKN